MRGDEVGEIKSFIPTKHEREELFLLCKHDLPIEQNLRQGVSWFGKGLKGGTRGGSMFLSAETGQEGGGDLLVGCLWRWHGLGAEGLKGKGGKEKFLFQGKDSSR